MYDFATRKALAKQHANPAHIPVYREMLVVLRRSSAGRIGFNGQRLAEELLYTLLGHYSLEEVKARTAPPVDHGSMVPAPRQENVEAPGQTPVPAVPEKPKMGKAEEYPNIDWRDLDNPLIRTADSIYSDRINCWRRLHELEAKTQGETADREVLAEMVETSIRSELCFQELRHFNDRGEFLGKHPFIAQKDERAQVLQLLRTDPDAYFEARKNLELNISRYSSQINGKKASDAVKARAKENLEKHQARLRIYKEVFAEFTAGK